MEFSLFSSKKKKEKKKVLKHGLAVGQVSAAKHRKGKTDLLHLLCLCKELIELQ